MEGLTAYEYLQSILTQAGKANKVKMAWDLICMAHDIEELRDRFSPQGFQKIQKVWSLYQAELEQSFKLQERIDEEIANATIYFDDDVLDEVNAYAIVYKDRIEVTANQPGMGDFIPKNNRRYVGGKGDMRWAFPLSMLEKIKTCQAVSFVLNEQGERI